MVYRTLKRNCVFGLLFLVLVSAGAAIVRADIFGAVRGIVHDPQHRPIAGAKVVLASATSSYSLSTTTNQDGEFTFNPVPLGDYRVTVSQTGFETATETLTVASASSPILHFPLNISSVNQTATVTGQAETANVQTVTPTTLVDREDIAQTPGADRSNGLEMITDYVPAAYVTHDMLHMRGGHQVDWLIDGVPIPNTNIATNLGPVIDPKDVDYLEIQRGSYDADYGDRTYGIFNIVPRNGFEGNSEGEIVTTFGNWYQTNDQINFGSHTDRFAYYASINGNRSNYGLQTPIGQVFHDAENGGGAFVSLIFNANPKNQIRLVASARGDYYQIPYDPDPNDYENSVYNTSQLRDVERESDSYAAFTWVHTFDPNLVLTVSPFYHNNVADYIGSPNDFPVITDVNQKANYGGLQATVGAHVAKNDLEAGIYGFEQSQNNYYNNLFTDGTPNPNPSYSTADVTGGLWEEFVSDKFKPASWLTIIGGLRQSHFDSPAFEGEPGVTENATDPRVGVALRIPRINWVLHAFYGDFYQAPPLSTATGQLFFVASGQDATFAPLHGERDQEHQFGLTIPFRQWSIDADTFQTEASNWLDHNNIGESNLFWPITWRLALIQSWELTLRSPRLWNRGQFHLAYANQIAQSAGPITGGLICGTPPADDCPVLVPDMLQPVDHDQRDTLNVGFDATLPWQSYVATNVYYGSGFTNGTPGAQYPGDYLPGHTTVDLSLGKNFGEKYSVSVTSLNIANRRVLLDNSLTFGGFHFNDPRQIYVEFRYRFHY
jgi:hypothetical protein